MYVYIFLLAEGWERCMVLTLDLVRSQMSAAEEDKMSDQELLGHMSYAHIS